MDRFEAAGNLHGAFLFLADFTFHCFASPVQKWCVVVFTALYHMTLACTNQNNYNMTYCYTAEDYIVHGLTVNDGLRGIVCFLSSLLGGRILNAVQRNGNRLFRYPLYGQHLLSAISLLLTAAAIIFNKTVVGRQKDARK